MQLISRLLSALVLVLGLVSPAFADPFFFTTLDVDGRIGVASRPASADGSKIEIEAADDFILGTDTLLYAAVFTGLMPANFGFGDIGNIKIEIYRVFPSDSDTTRTPNVPTRTNSPADVQFDSRSTAEGTLYASFEVVQFQYQVSNSVLNG